MGVMSCCRRGCNNILCDRRSSTHGYICSECFDELIESGIGTNISDFMDSEKVAVPNKVNAFEVFNNEFPL